MPRKARKSQSSRLFHILMAYFLPQIGPRPNFLPPSPPETHPTSLNMYVLTYFINNIMFRAIVWWMCFYRQTFDGLQLALELGLLHPAGRGASRTSPPFRKGGVGNRSSRCSLPLITLTYYSSENEELVEENWSVSASASRWALAVSNPKTLSTLISI